MYPSHFEVDNRRLPDGFTTTGLSSGSTSTCCLHDGFTTFELSHGHRVADMPPETAHPVFPQCNRHHTAATTVHTVATLLLAVRLTRDNR